MAVDYDKFVAWAKNKFGPSAVKEEGDEVKLNSIFKNDTKHHLYCNPFGGKKQIYSGVYHCWKSDRRGTLIGLVMEVEKCNKKEAMEILGITTSKGVPIEEVIDFDTNEPAGLEDVLLKDDWQTINLPPYTYPINKAPENWYQSCLKVLKERKLTTDGLFVCTNSKYYGRIIIPYYSPDNRLIYFNGRTIVGSSEKYKGPEKTIGVGKGDVLYFTSYPKEGEKVYLCEGEFDAKSLEAIGLVGVACGGKELTLKQACFLSCYRVCIAFDADEAGENSIEKIQYKLNSYCTIPSKNRLSKVVPPAIYKDWNKFYSSHDAKIMKAYIAKNEEELESETPYGNY